jgi:hypothetical protein
MGSALLERYDDRIAGVLSCYDRVVITGTLPTVCSRFPSFRKSDEWRKRILQAAWSLRKDSRRLA